MSVIEMNSDRIAAIQITVEMKTFLVINIYMPTENIEFIAKFISCLGRVNAVVEESQVQVGYIMGDFNAHLNAVFGKELLSLRGEQNWDCVDLTKIDISSDTFTYIDQTHGS